MPFVSPPPLSSSCSSDSPTWLVGWFLSGYERRGEEIGRKGETEQIEYRNANEMESVKAPFPCGREID